MNSLLVKVSAIIVLIPIIMFASKQVDGAVFGHYGAERVEKPKSIIVTDMKNNRIDNRQSAVKKHLRAETKSSVKPEQVKPDSSNGDIAVPELRGFAAPDEIIFPDSFPTDINPVTDIVKMPVANVELVEIENESIPELRR